jgi:transposase
MKQMYFIGVDVSKGKLDVCVISMQGQVIIEKVIGNNRSAIRNFIEKLLRSMKAEKQDVLICCEHTGIYCRPLQLVATEMGYSLWLENAYKINRASTDLRGKSDKKDALRIAEYALRYSDRKSLYSEAPDAIAQLRTLLDARSTLLEKLSSLRQQVNECRKFDPGKYNLLKSCYGQSIRTLVKELKRMKERIAELVASNEKLAIDAKLLQSIPGIGEQVSLNFISITNGMTSFETAKQLACYAGVVPFPNQSGTVVRKDRVSRFANKKLKKLLHLAAMAAVKAQGDLRNYYLRKVKEGKNKMAVLNAVRNKLVHRMVAVLKRQQPYVQLQR